MVLRIVIVVALALAVLGAHRWYRRWRTRVVAHRPVHPRVPDALLGGGERTWIVFTTPYCASCGPVTDELRATDPLAHVVQVDVTRDPALGSAFEVRAAPTVVLADGDGTVRERLVGASAVRDFVRAGSARR